MSSPMPDLSPLEARILGVLVEKEKTTPDTYPLTLNSLAAGCNQKTSRDPVMSVGESAIQGALEELAAIGVEIIRNARNELYLSMRFLDVVLNGLFPVADNSIKGIGTDGTLLSFETGYICGWYRRNPVYVNRMILHETFHCLFVHPWSRKKRAEEYWNLACDIAVESLIDGIHKPCVHLPMSPVRAEFYGRLRKKIKVLNAESIYHTMQEMELSEIEYERLCREFCRDDHSRWEKEDEKKSQIGRAHV